MNRFGFHAPNKQPYEIDKMLNVGGDCYTVLCAVELPYVDFVREIRQKRPNAIIILRPYWGPTNLYDNPVDIARGCLDIVWPCLEYTNHVVVGNEPNVEVLEWASDRWNPDYWKRWNEWALAALEVLRELPIIVHLPAMSPAVGDDPQQMNPPGYEYLREAVEAYDKLDQHVYWKEAWSGEGYDSVWAGKRYEMLHALFPSKEIYLTEVGPTSVTDAARAEIPAWFAALPDYVRFAAFFSWNWGVEGYSYWNKDGLLDILRAMPKPDAPPFEPPAPREFYWPLAQPRVVTQPFGNTDVPPGVTYMIHEGVDWRAEVGTPVYACADGLAIIGYSESLGNYVWQTNLAGGADIALYGHLDVALKQGWVKAGDLIAKTGKSGNVTGPHLHFGIKVRGTYVDPVPYLEGAKEPVQPAPPAEPTCEEQLKQCREERERWQTASAAAEKYIEELEARIHAALNVLKP